ncbi:MAG: site-specific integrase [Thiobacillaceae bacterium]|jgi:integrase|nr:site-specific integrase [Thiobacillaceae bacterium]
MAKPYLDGKGWAIRLRHRKQEIYLSGFATEAAAKKAAAQKRRAIDGTGKPKGLGPWRTSLGQALQNYGLERLPFLKGAQQEARRINRYLRTLGLDLLKPTERVPEDGKDPGKGPFWIVELVPCPDARVVPKGLHQHRDKQARQTAGSDRLRALLARTMMSDVTPYQVQDLMDTMQSEGYEAATVEQERSLLRILFNHARDIWTWPEPMRNPASGLKMPKIDNKRERVLTNAEWDRLSATLKRAKNRYIGPAVALLLVTTMRASEALFTARWSDVDLDRHILTLRTAKAGGRKVPLSPEAVEILRKLKEWAGEPDPAARILPISYERLKAAWNLACARAGIEDVHIQDLRHTGATHYALEYNGNAYILKKITGHKTDAQLSRYVNINTDDVAQIMHGRQPDDLLAPAGLTAERLRALFGKAEAETSQPAEPDPRPDNVLRVDFSRRAA